MNDTGDNIPKSNKTRGYAHDVDAWVQFQLLRLASFHPKTTKADLAVLAEIIQKYYGKYGNGWASHDMLIAATGTSKATIIRAKRNLERLGFVSVLQAGRRGSATVYRPNFGLISKKGITDDTETLGITDDTLSDGIGVTDATATPLCGVTDDTPSYIPDRPTRAESRIDRSDCTAPLAPLADGLGATTARVVQEGGFEQLWNAYGYRQRKTDARAAFEKLARTTEQVGEMIGAAKAWRLAWEAQDKPEAPRFTLAKWIEREEFECDPPTPFKEKVHKPKASKPDALPKPAKASPAEQPSVPLTAEAMNLRPAMMIGETSPFADFGEFTAEIEAATVSEPEDGERVIRLDIDLGECRNTYHEFAIQSRNPEKQRLGMEMLNSIIDATGASYPCTDTDDLLFKSFRCSTGIVGNLFCIAYEPLAANDNLKPVDAVA